jgi:hypothetical protein
MAERPIFKQENREPTRLVPRPTFPPGHRCHVPTLLNGMTTGGCVRLSFNRELLFTFLKHPSLSCWGMCN